MYTDSGHRGVIDRSDGFDVVSARNTARLFAMTPTPPLPPTPSLSSLPPSLSPQRQPAGAGPEGSNQMSQLFSVDKEAATGANVLELSLPDQLDDSDFDRLNEALLGLINDASRNWVVDLSRVDYMGSAMLGMMVNLRQQVKNAKGRLVLCGMSQRLTDIFRTCCMERLFTITRTKADALRMVK